MSNVNYTLNRRGVRLIGADEAWVRGKNGKRRLNPKFTFVGKINVSMPNMIVSASDSRKPSYRGDVNELPRAAKQQIIDHFYESDGKRNKRKVVYFGILKENKTKK